MAGAVPTLVGNNPTCLTDVAPSRELQEKLAAEFKGHSLLEAWRQADQQRLKKFLGADISVPDPDSFFTDPDPGFFYPDSGSGSRQQKTNFFKAKIKFWEKFWFPTLNVGILFLFSTNQVGIVLNRELLFGIIFKNK